MDIGLGIGQNIEELVNYRKEVRAAKNYELADAIRNFLDKHLVFAFDQKDGFQEVYYLTDSYFDKLHWYMDKDKDNKDVKITETTMQKMERLHNTKFKSKRQFVEFRIKQDIKYNNIFDAWVFSNTPAVR